MTKKLLHSCTEIRKKCFYRKILVLKLQHKGAYLLQSVCHLMGTQSRAGPTVPVFDMINPGVVKFLMLDFLLGDCWGETCAFVPFSLVLEKFILMLFCRYHAHLHTNGTKCDLTNEPRETEVYAILVSKYSPSIMHRWGEFALSCSFQ